MYYNSEESIKEEFKEVYIEDYGCVTINNLGTKMYTKTGKFPAIYQHGRAKLNENQVKEIKEKYTGKRGEIASLAKEYKVSWSLIKLIVTDKNWKHVNSSNS